MTKTWYVIDGEGNTLWQGKEHDDAPQVFKTFAAAEKRAKEAAECDPGTEFKIVGAEAIVTCDVRRAAGKDIKTGFIALRRVLTKG